VVGYSVALVPNVVDGRREAPVWFGAGRLDKALALGQLRARWGEERAGDPALVPVWTRNWRTSAAADKVALTNPPADAGAALAGLQGRLDDGAQRLAAIDAAGALARASIALEKDQPGPLAEASDALARAGQPSKWDARDPGRRAREQAALEAAYAARLVARATGRDSKRGWIGVLRQVERTARAVAHAQQLQARIQAAQRTYAALAAVVEVVPQMTTAQRAGVTPVALRATPTYRRNVDLSRDAKGYDRG
ncbi:hypothetical protein, partial [Puerhibacterium puerhi]|uniref:hypothetical protein n=1 Tax=Puerhibacterium puerhi TaxID=2692623 RepID=UPI001B3BAF39